jgi:CDP-paratose 2-epimerase
MPRVLITGGCGFIGSNCAAGLAARGFDIVALDNLSRRGSEYLSRRVMERGVSFVRGDVRNPADLEGLTGDFDLLIECCAEPSVLAGARGDGARYLLDVNLLGAINCFEWARVRRVPVIFLSTSRVYPYDVINSCQYTEMPTRFELAEGVHGVTSSGVSTEMPLTGRRSLYGASKLSAEFILQEYAAQYDLPAVINRCGVIAGPWQMARADQGVFTFWMAQHYFKRDLKYIGFGGAGRQVRDLLHVDDLVCLIAAQAAQLMTGDKRPRGDVYNAGGTSSISLSLMEATALCAQLTGNPIAIGCDAQERPADVRWFVTDNGETGAAFDWKPRHSAPGIMQDIFEWINRNESLLKEIL